MDKLLKKMVNEVVKGIKEGRLKFWKSEYWNGNTYLELNDVVEGELYGDFSINILPLGDPKYICVNINNTMTAPYVLEKLNIAKPTGETLSSGYSVYPIYEIDEDVLDKYLIKEAA